MPRDADGHLSGNQHPGRDGDLELYRPQHAGDGAARHHLQPVFDQLQRQRHQEHRGADHGRSVGAEDLLPAGRQSRPRDRADRLGDQRHPRAVAAGDPGAARGAVQRLERAGAADQPEFRHAQRTAALRLRHLSDPPATGADPRHHAADAGRRKVSPDHGRSRSVKAARQGTDAARRRECRQCAEPDAAGGHGEDRQHAIRRPHQRDAGDASTISTTFRSRSSMARPSS